MKVEVIAHPTIEARLDGETLRPGSVVDLEPELGWAWVRLKIAQPVSGGQRDEAAILEPEETAVRPEPKKRKRGRPRKGEA